MEDRSFAERPVIVLAMSAAMFDILDPGFARLAWKIREGLVATI
jgi:hypothetical protein